MNNAAHTQPAERDRVHAEWTTEALQLRDEVRAQNITLCLGVAMLAEKIARARSEWCGNFPVRVLPEDMRCALAGFEEFKTAAA